MNQIKKPQYSIMKNSIKTFTFLKIYDFINILNNARYCRNVLILLHIIFQINICEIYEVFMEIAEVYINGL